MKSLSLSQPHAIIMVGIPGSGKSYFAKKFSDTFSAPYINLDDIILHSAGPESAGALAENQLNELTKTNLPIVLELNTATRQHRTELAKRLKAVDYVPLFVWVQVDTETARQRIMRNKQKDVSEFDGQIRRFSHPHSSEKPLVISGKHTYASQAKVVLRHLSAPRADISAHQQPAVRSGQNIIVR